ncbi:cellulose biosynthesis cyclic di-GMP-binding regulatory protein BcsB [Pusillimonas sp. CC-YST705]|uniref:Cyclic di-GMP-binding protein n=1 Tax=Mesopusillimonas faecipullorum TaxID=2755040 RepID=A0ABS8CER0_9BURK|nr:cellulose biosynthesis cyclic di-GMP-binding regulatory protein BcsB [Mesopusillimonas faecipullorum]MCB5364535.1 cellulose biosynthesis cyclic di-GMP-binding regulatory protein BcsB [Mesopusillimonas faecipullorum]
MMRSLFKLRRRIGLISLFYACSALANVASDSATVPPAATAYPAPISALEAQAAQPRTLRFTLQELGARYPFALRGVDGFQSLPLHLPDDLQVISANLKLRYQHSPDLLETLSHLNVQLDGKHVASVPLSTDEEEDFREHIVPLPATALQEDAELGLQLIGHYTLRCENPRHPSLWADVDNQSELELEVLPRPRSNDLNRLPRPFFDPRSLTLLELPFVFAQSPDTATLEAAGVLSSWFGALADYRGARFPVAHGELPASGNAVVLVTSDTRITGLTLPPITGPSVSMMDHPSGQGGKLLLVMGRQAQELKQAALAIAVGGGQTFSGNPARLTQLELPAPRKPYDAPRWLPGDRPVPLGSLAREAAMEVRGFSGGAITVGFRVPPDLYAWRDAEVPLNLRYRYTPRTNSERSTLQVRLNHQQLADLPIPKAVPGKTDYPWSTQLGRGDDTVPAEARLLLPVSTLAAESQLEFLFNYEYLSRGECKDVLTDTVRGRIDPQSTLDISGLPRFIALPSMAAFGNGGFPFTRLADLSETAVVLPDTSGSQEQSAYLDLLGVMGASTGYPATRVQVATTKQLGTLDGKDILVISGQDARQTLGDWASHMPIQPDALPTQNTTPETLWERLWHKTFGEAVAQDGPKSTGPAALLSGFESPLSRGRSVVVVASAQPGELQLATTALLNPELLRQVHGSSVGIYADSVRVLEDRTRYHAGSLGLVRHTLWFFQQHPIVFILLAALTVTVLGLLLYLTLRARARMRLDV